MTTVCIDLSIDAMTNFLNAISIHCIRTLTKERCSWSQVSNKISQTFDVVKSDVTVVLHLLVHDPGFPDRVKKILIIC